MDKLYVNRVRLLSQPSSFVTQLNKYKKTWSSQKEFWASGGERSKFWPISELFLVWPLTIAVQPDSTTGAEMNTLLASEKF